MASQQCHQLPRFAARVLARSGPSALESMLFKKEVAKVKFDRTAYQREYVRKWRAK
jgi:hypothetical protein